MFGAGVRGRSGWPEVRRTIAWVAGRFGACDRLRVRAGRRPTCTATSRTPAVSSATPQPAHGGALTNELRVTQIYRRENGVWKIVHRHGDHAMPVDPDTD